MFKLTWVQAKTTNSGFFFLTATRCIFWQE